MSTTLDQLIAVIVASSTIQEVQKDVIPMFKKLEKASSSKKDSTTGWTILEGTMEDGRDPLTLLNPTESSVGFLYILNARLAVSQPDLNTLHAHAVTLTEVANVQQLRFVPEQVSLLVRSLTNLADNATQLDLAILPIQNILLRLVTPGYLTWIHPYFLQIVTITRQYSSAQRIVQQDITDIDPSFGQVRYQDHLTYHYLGGVVKALLGENERAIEMLEIAVSAPGQAVSAIQIDAYKKLVLVQLLTTGKFDALPKYTSSAVTSAIKSLCKPYLDYAIAYGALDKYKLSILVDKHREVFEQDLNWGLVTRVNLSFRRRMIQKLTETFITLSLGEIAKHVDLDPNDETALKEVEDEVSRMITNGEIHGSITSSPSSTLAQTTVTFSDDPEIYATHETVERVSKAIRKAQELDRELRGRELRIGRGKEFVQKAYNAAGQASALSAGGGAGGIGGSGLGGGADDFDLAIGGADWDDGEDD